MTKRIFIDRYGGNVFGALAEDQKLIEFHIEKHRNKKLVGSIFKGVVENVLTGMDAAFVNIGLGRNAYLNTQEMLIDKSEIDEKLLTNTINLKKGEEIMVQVTKDEFGNKGAKVSPHVSIAGRYLVFTPTIDFVGISRKIENEKDRENLADLINKNKENGTGYIVRTAALTASKSEIKSEMEYLTAIYENVKKKFETVKPTEIVYEEGDLPLRLIRDMFNKEIDEIVIGDKIIYDRIYDMFNSYKDYNKKKLVYYNSRVEMLKAYGLGTEINSMLKSRVDLVSGAYLIFNKTEALTVIDVNSGSYVGDLNIEETALKVNLESANEIARQVRLRNLGGIIVIDFIDLHLEENRVLLISKLEEELKKDRIKCTIHNLSDLSLVQFTRKKTRIDNETILKMECDHCKGTGYISSYDYMVMKLRTTILDLFAQEFESVIIHLNDKLSDYLLRNRILSLDALKIWSEKRIYLVPHEEYHFEKFEMNSSNDEVLTLPANATLLN